MRKTFEEKFCKSADEMTDGEWRMAVVDLFSGVYDRLDITNGSVKQTYKNTNKINLIWVIGGIYGVVFGGALVWVCLSYAKHFGVP